MLIFLSLLSVFLYLLFLFVFFNSLFLFNYLLSFLFPSIFFLWFFLSHIDHLNLAHLRFQKSYPFFDRTHIFPLDQIHSCTDLFHHIWNKPIWSNLLRYALRFSNKQQKTKKHRNQKLFHSQKSLNPIHKSPFASRSSMM